MVRYVMYATLNPLGNMCVTMQPLPITMMDGSSSLTPLRAMVNYDPASPSIIAPTETLKVI